MRLVLRNKIWALFILSAFLITQGGYAQQPAAIGEAISEGGQQVGFKPGGGPAVVAPRTGMVEGVNPYNLLVPDKYGKVEEVFQGAQDAPMIVHIQDAHANYEAQLNIKQILSHLSKNYNINLIQLEGASSKLDPSVFETAYIKEANLKLADYLMREGRLSGAEAFAIESKESVELHGVENRMLYMENLRTFRLVYSHQEEINAYFKAMRVLAKDLRTKLLNEELLDLTRNMEAYAQERIDLLDYLLYLDKLASRHRLASLRSLAEIARFPNLVRILRMNDLEKRMNEAELKKEAAAIKNNFREKTRDPEVLELLASLELRKKGMKPRIYFRKLTELAEKHGVDLLRYPQMRTLAEFLILQDEIEHHGLFVEVERLEKLIQKRLLRKKAERELIQLLKALELLEQYFKLEVNREKLAYIIRRYEQMRASQIKRELDQLAQKFDVLPSDYAGDILKIDQYMDEVEYFYRVVLERDRLFVENVLAKVKAGGVNRTVLITGGFHTDGLTALLRKQNISYAVVIPKVDVKQGNEKYVKIMMEEESEIGSVFAGTFALSQALRSVAADLFPGLPYVLMNDYIEVFTAGQTFSRYVQATTGVISTPEDIADATERFERQQLIRGVPVGEAVTQDGVTTLQFDIYRRDERGQVVRARYDTAVIDGNEFKTTRVSPKWEDAKRDEIARLNLDQLQNPGAIAGTQLPAARAFTGTPLFVSTRAIDLAEPTQVTTAEITRANFPTVLADSQAFTGLLVPARGNEALATVPGIARFVAPSPFTVSALASVVAQAAPGVTIPDLIAAARVTTQAVPEITDDHVRQAVADPGRQRNLSALLGLLRVQRPAVSAIHIPSATQPSTAIAQIVAAVSSARDNPKAAFLIVGDNVTNRYAQAASLGVARDVLKRIKFVDVPDDKAEQEIEAFLRKGLFFNFYRSATGERVSYAEFQRSVRTGVIIPERAEKLSERLTARWSNVRQILSVLENPDVVRDRTLSEILGDLQVRASQILPLKEEEKAEFFRILRDIDLGGVFVDLGNNRWQIGLSERVRELLMDYLAAREIAIRA